jgi:hypothetical protein
VNKITVNSGKYKGADQLGVKSDRETDRSGHEKTPLAVIDSAIFPGNLWAWRGYSTRIRAA